jgi:RimJ/RimL family protein N-acetyltransferase
MTKMNIRPLQVEDASSWQELRLEGLQTDPSAFASSYEEESSRSITDVETQFMESWNKPDHFILGCFYRDQLISIAGLFPETMEKRKHIATIWGVYTKTNFRGQGVASLVMMEIIKMAKKNIHLKRINLSVEVKNISAIALYKKFGFNEWGIEPNALVIHDKSYDELYMSYQL